MAIAVCAGALRADDAYIESDGTTFVNSRWFMNPQGKVEVDFALVSAEKPSSWQFLFGAFDRTSGSTIATRIGFFFNANGPYAVAGDAADKWISKYDEPDTERRIVSIEMPAKKWRYYKKGSAAADRDMNADSTVSSAATYPVALFGNMGGPSGLATANISGSCLIAARIYRARFWTGDRLDHDYTPCVKGGVPGFIDAVDGEFVTAENPAALTAGGDTPEIADDGYISTYGNNAAKGKNLYIDTGYIVKDSTKIELDYALADNYPGSGDWDVFASCKNKFNLYFNANGGNWCGPNQQWQAFSSAIARRTTDRDVRRKIVMDNSIYQATFTTAGFTNAVGVSTASSGTDYTTPASGAVANLRLASRVDASATKTSCAAPLKIYGLKIYEGGALVHDYVPYLRDGVAGLLDKEGDGGFITCFKGSADSQCGGAIEMDDASTGAYIEGDGTLAFNTGYAMTKASRVEVDFRFLDLLDRNCAIFGSWTTTHNNTAGYKNGSGGFSIALSDGSLSASTMANKADLLRHKAIIDAPAKKLHYVTGTATNTADAASGYAGTGVSTIPMGLLAGIGNAAATTWNLASKARIYSMRIYETNGGEETKVHEFLPYKDGDVIGFRDAVTGKVLEVANGSDAVPGYGGMGVDGAERWFAAPASRSLNKGTSCTFSANASGAVAYRWTKNGAAISGGESGDLVVNWAKGGATDAYTVTAVYDVYGETVCGEPVAFAVENMRLGMVVIVR